MKKLVALAAIVCAVSVPMSARADDTVQSSKIVVVNNQRTIVLRDFIVYGRYLHPIAVVDAAKLPMKLTMTELRQPLLARVEPPVHSAPF
jgi:hypothetical protein